MARKLEAGERLVLASHNRHKLGELVELLRPHRIDVTSAGGMGLPEPVEDACDFVGNARIKAHAAATATGLPSLADDSGLGVAALGGAPGIYSARWAGATKDFATAMARVNRELDDAADRRAWFVAALCIAWPDGHAETFVGRVNGTVIWPPRGNQGFGYDPMFVPTRGTLTFGEMDAADKRAVSHRARALAQFLAACFSGSKQGDGTAKHAEHAN